MLQQMVMREKQMTSNQASFAQTRSSILNTYCTRSLNASESFKVKLNINVYP